MSPLRIRKSVRLLLLALACVATAAMPARAQACSLADHIRSANTNTSIGGCPQGTSHDIITITEDITLSEALPPITGTITIEGNGHTISGDFTHRILDVNGGRLTVNNLTFTQGLADSGGAMRLRNGAQARVANARFEINRATNGGAIAMADDNVSLEVDGSSFAKNSAGDYGGAIHAFRGEASIRNSSFIQNRGVIGGAIYAINRKVDVANSTFSENRSGAGGGALDLVSGEFTLTHLTFVGNRSDTGTGNAIKRNGGNVYLRNSILADGDFGDECEGILRQNVGNLSRDGSCSMQGLDDVRLGELTASPAYYRLLDNSPALDAADPQYCLDTDQLGTARPQGGACDVGAIESANARPAQPPIEPPPPCPLADQIIAANTDAPSGGCRAGSGADVITLDEDIRLRSRLPAITSDITIEGNGHTISGRRRFRIFDVDGGKLTINNLRLTEGLTQANGGAIKVHNFGQATINNAHFSHHYASNGGAIYMAHPNRGLWINNSHFAGNRSNYSGGAITNWSGTTTIRNSSFVGNSNGSSGGAIDSSGSGTTRISNSSFVENRALFGGAIHTHSSGTTDVSNSTFIDNESGLYADLTDASSAIYAGGVTTLTHVTMSGGGLFVPKWGELNLRNSIVFADTEPEKCHGKLAQNFGNLISDGSCEPALQEDPLLGERTGHPAYLPLDVSSPAINAAHQAYCPATDQRGAPRPQVGGCDIGAIEMPPAHIDLVGCRVTTSAGLNFRDWPGGNKIGLVAAGAAMPAIARTSRWFEVEHDGQTGWISADYVETEGDCG